MDGYFYCFNIMELYYVVLCKFLLLYSVSNYYKYLKHTHTHTHVYMLTRKYITEI
jgi:hypothetical protein